jgi:hypothetical protein
MKYKLPELKDFCKKYGLRVSGTKTELCARLSDKFSCDLKVKDDDREFNSDKCKGDNPSYSKYELEKFAENNNVKISKKDTKKDICKKLLNKVDCKELEVVEVSTPKSSSSKRKSKSPKSPKKRSSSKKKEVESESEDDHPKRKSSKKSSKKDIEIEVESDSEDEENKIKSDFENQYEIDDTKFWQMSYTENNKKKKLGGIFVDLKKNSKSVLELVVDKIGVKNFKKLDKDELVTEIEKLLKGKGNVSIKKKEKSRDELELRLKKKIDNFNKKKYDSSVDIHRVIDMFGVSKNIISKSDLSDFNKLNETEIVIFCDFYSSKDDLSFHDALEYFIPEKDYRTFFSKYYVREFIKKDDTGDEIVKKYGDLLGRDLLNKFKSLSKTKRNELVKKYIQGIKPLSYFMKVNKCNESGNGDDLSCEEGVCNISLGQCVDKDSQGKYENDTIKGQEIIGTKDAISALKKKLKPKNDNIVKLDFSTKRGKQLTILFKSLFVTDIRNHKKLNLLVCKKEASFSYVYATNKEDDDDILDLTDFYDDPKKTISNAPVVCVLENSSLEKLISEPVTNGVLVVKRLAKTDVPNFLILESIKLSKGNNYKVVDMDESEEDVLIKLDTNKKKIPKKSSPKIVIDDESTTEEEIEEKKEDIKYKDFIKYIKSNLTRNDDDNILYMAAEQFGFNYILNLEKTDPSFFRKYSGEIENFIEAFNNTTKESRKKNFSNNFISGKYDFGDSEEELQREEDERKLKSLSEIKSTRPEILKKKEEYRKFMEGEEIDEEYEAPTKPITPRGKGFKSGANKPTGDILLENLTDLYDGLLKDGKEKEKNKPKKTKWDDEEDDNSIPQPAWEKEDEEEIELKRQNEEERMKKDEEWMEREEKRRRRREKEEREERKQKELDEQDERRGREIQDEERIKKEEKKLRDEEKAREKERIKYEEELKEAEVQRRKRAAEATVVKLGKNKEEESRKAENARRRIEDALKKKEEEEEIDELPSKEEILNLSKELSKPQQEIAKCLGLSS